MKRLAWVLFVASLACAKSETPQSATAQPTTAQAAPPPATSAANPAHGQQLIVQYGCTACHAIPGIEGAQGSLAPALAHVAARPTISNNKVQNTPENLQRFIQNPPSMNPGSGMPPLAIPDADAHDIVAYLETLR
ncbi:MAG: c-type cytochrome [Acidobacteria bacterium]|nr:c-type cytochrome [Acidobacteriota bacterium]MBV9478903.1 c-type cytochrome [Acidobacteriota bacterium]